MRSEPEELSAEDAGIIGFVCPVYKWDVPGTFKKFISKLTVNPNEYADKNYVILRSFWFICKNRPNC